MNNNRVLAERGLEHLVNHYLVTNEGEPAGVHVEPGTSVGQEDSLLRLVTEEPVPLTPEVVAIRQEIASSFTRAVELLSDITGGDYATIQREGPIFVKALIAEDVDVHDTKDPRYWLTLRKILSFGDGAWLKDKGYSEHDLESLDLLTLTPVAIYAQVTLDRYRAGTINFRMSNLSKEDQAIFLESKQLVSKYNSLIRDFAEQNPEVHAYDIKDSIEDTLDFFVYFNEQKAVKESIDAILVGAQHEAAFGQILQVLKDEYGYDFRPATAEEDTGRGDARYKGKFFDYVVTTPDGKELLIDVKASKKAVQDLGITGLMGRRGDGTYVIASGLQAVLANTGKFFIASKEAKQMADTYENTGMIRDIDDVIQRNNN